MCCVVPMSMHYILCLVTVCMKVLQKGRLFRFSKRTDCWCVFSWSICNQNSHFIRCIHSSSFQVCDKIYKSWEDIISQEEYWSKTKLSERHCRTLNRMSINRRSTAAKVTAELNIHLEDHCHKNSLIKASQIQHPW